MERSRLGLILILIGAILFVISLFVLLLYNDFYLFSLFAMFLAVILIAIGFAYARGVDSFIDYTSDDCFYCKGSGKIDTETCPRCGGTGIARADY